jgi:hypothetical protein
VSFAETFGNTPSLAQLQPPKGHHKTSVEEELGVNMGEHISLCLSPALVSKQPKVWANNSSTAESIV